MTLMKTTDVKATLALVTIAAALSSLALAGLAHGTGGGVVSVLNSQPTHWSDRGADPASVTASRTDLARAIDSATEDNQERAALTTLAIHESRLALYVLEGRCSDGPKGACDNGRAFGPWQLHATRDVPIIPAALGEQAVIALKRWRSHRKRCLAHGPAGAFTGYGTGGWCGPAKWARERVATLAQVEARLWGGQ